MRLKSRHGPLLTLALVLPTGCSDDGPTPGDAEAGDGDDDPGETGDGDGDGVELSGVTCEGQRLAPVTSTSVGCPVDMS